MFSFIKEKIKSAFKHIKSGISALLHSGKEWDSQTLSQLETLLIESEFGYKTTKEILEKLKHTHATEKETFNPSLLLKDHLTHMISGKKEFHEEDGLYFLCGINGSGKTTTAIKLALHFKAKNKKTLLIAADTFRAAAREQLAKQATSHSLDIFIPEETDNPSSAIYKGLSFANEHRYERVIIDTAGRIHTKEPLMQELAKMHKVAEKTMPHQGKRFLLTLDVTMGQNLFEQADLFNQATPLDGLILTKFDALTKPGIIFSIVDKLKIPVAYLTYGESPEALSLFDKDELVNRVLNE